MAGPYALYFLQTVIGYIETPGDDPPRITDVEHIEYPDGTSDHLAFTILADKDVLEEFNREQIQRMLKSNDPRARSPASLRALLMRNFGSEALKKYEQRFASYDDLYCMVDAVSTGHRHGSQFSINYALYLSRTQANGAFTLRAMKTDLAVEHGRAGW
ncbi:hypothetical protein FOZ60_014034 [Perkinsus olseni]|uniref:Uncharacterized protein n=2 Tax=Perkinsus olseni TaxID=32597 RepID=A0A7J6N897_PEROL|nr:hypothetical protein FOZ60_014034 [Perkinsus olseni]